MKKWGIPFLTVFVVLLAVPACPPQTEAEETQSVLPRELAGYTLGDKFEPGDKFQVDEDAAVFRFNEVEGVTYKSIPSDSETDQQQITICTINDRIFKIITTEPMEFSDADSKLAVFLTMYGNALERENRPASKTDMQWINFSDETTALRIEFLVKTLTIELSAYDLQP